MEGRGFLYPGQWKDLWHTYRMLPIWSSGKKKQPLGYSFFAFLIPFASFPSQESINILDRETAAFINSRRRERSRFCSFLSFWSRAILSAGCLHQTNKKTNTNIKTKIFRCIVSLCPAFALLSDWNHCLKISLAAPTKVRGWWSEPNKMSYVNIQCKYRNMGLALIKLFVKRANPHNWKN